MSSPAPVARMDDHPGELTSTQQEAQTILRHLLQTLRDPGSKYYERYGKWIKRHPKLEEFCFECIRPNVWRFLDGRWNMDALKSIGGDLRFEGRGVYFDGVLGLDRQIRIYIGQSTNLRFRISQHWNFRYRRDNPSLHYHAIQQSIFNVFGIIAVLPSPNMGNHILPGMDYPDLLLNVLEMWTCLVFRSLPQQVLATSLPEDARMDGEFGALNIASPLDNGAKEREWFDLSDWEDPLVQEYLCANRTTSSGTRNYGEQPIRQPNRMTTDGKNKQTGGDQTVIQITAPALLLIGVATVAGYLILKGVSGPGRR